MSWINTRVKRKRNGIRIGKRVRIRIGKKVRIRIRLKIGIGIGKMEMEMVRMSNLIPSTIGMKIGMMKKTSMRMIF